MQVLRSQLKRDWLQSELGDALLRAEVRMMEDLLDGVFGEQCLQLGMWGDKRSFLRFPRTQRSALISEDAWGEPCTVGDLHRLPVASDSIDAVFLPHTLDYCDRPHEVLREVDRILRLDGRLIVLGFKPGGLWGLRRLIPGADLPPGADDLISERRLKDWLKLLNMRVQGSSRYFFRWPLAGGKPSATEKWERRGQAWWPELAACYMLSAQKRVSTITPVRPMWLRKPKVVAGLAEPSTRVSRIRFDENH